jgi:GAF domain
MSQIQTLQSWKEIANYIHRGTRTVQRWELLGLPIRRVPGASRKSTVYAVAHELDTWLLNNPQHSRSIQAHNSRASVPASLEKILITDRLARRTLKLSRSADRTSVLKALAEEITGPPETLLGVLVNHALSLCSAGSAGLSLLHAEDEQQFFHWDAMAGRLKDCVGQTTPRNFSPCGITLDRRSPQLFSYPERYFPYLKKAMVPIVEGLVIPIFVDGRGLGTIWVVSHDTSCEFNSDDVSTMTSLAAFCEAALSCHSRGTHVSVNARPADKYPKTA